MTISNINRCVFTGDTIFVGGCGRFFEGKPDQMLAAMDVARALPEDTIVLCGHEYTMANLKFCNTAEGQSNGKVAEFTKMFQERLDSGRPSIPTTMGEEKQFNVFMRCREPALQ
jgi:hydroxyacylglutathione hydrolase